MDKSSLKVEKLNQLSGRPVYVDLIRTTAIVGVILLHAAGSWITNPQQMNALNFLGVASWTVVDIYQSIARICVPLFIMLTGALLLQPEKTESISSFFKKRWARIGLPFLFWGAAYFVWDFLVIKIPFTSGAIIQGILNGPYTQFWYLYVLIGLYLLTPVLRIFLAKADQTTTKYLIVLSFLGLAIAPVLSSVVPYTLNSNVFTITGYIGYFVLGLYLLTVKTRSKTLLILVFLGISLTAAFTYVLAATIGGTNMYLFQQYFSPTVILASVAVFMLLLKIQPPSFNGDCSNSPQVELSKINKLIKVISENTLAIFLFHVMLLESLERGYFGFAINSLTLNPIIEVPLITVIVLFVSLGVVVLLKKIPYVEKLIG
jgi:surface polysaccharide O-acyltransferase-like enzyme